MTQIPGDADYRHRAAALLRSATNDLKRDDATAARELGLPIDTFRGYVNGELAISWELLMRAARVWPVNERDLLPHHCDVPAGVLVCTAEESAESSRVLKRRGIDYYEYRDTAMSRIATYRPEWIRMLRVVHDVDPLNPGIEWNEGHLLYQFTYFIGPVNYYYSSEAHQYCEAMTTGDSVWGLPFTPHSFAARDANVDAYILALTYGGNLLGDAQRELALLGPDAAASLALETALPRDSQASVLQSLLTARLLPYAEVARRAGIDEHHLEALCEGSAEASWHDLKTLASALGVSVRDLLPRITNAQGGVSIQRHEYASRWIYPNADRAAYSVVQLAGDSLHPETTAFEIEALETQPAAAGSQLVTHQHSYTYVLTGKAIISWVHRGDSYVRELQPGDSVYIAPAMSVSYTSSRSDPAKLLLLRIGGAVSTDVRFALSSLSERQMRRYLLEDQLWYRPEGHSLGLQD